MSISHHVNHHFSEPIKTNERMVLITTTGPAAELAGELKLSSLGLG